MTKRKMNISTWAFAAASKKRPLEDYPKGRCQTGCRRLPYLCISLVSVDREADWVVVVLSLSHEQPTKETRASEARQERMRYFMWSCWQGPRQKQNLIVG